MEWNVLWEIIKEVFSIIGDTALFIIAVYTFYFTFFPQLQFLGLNQKRDVFKGDCISVTLENRGLSPVCIKSIEIVSNEYKVTIFSKKEENDECIIEGFKASTIDMAPFSALHTEQGDLDLIRFEPKYLIVKTLRKTFYIDLNERKHSYKTKKLNKKHPPKETFSFHATYNGLTITPDIKYAIEYIDKFQKIHTILVLESGFMSDHIMGFNAIPEKHLTNATTLKNFLNEKFKDMDFRVDEMNKQLGL